MHPSRTQGVWEQVTLYMRVVRSRFADPSKIDEAIGQVASDVAAAYSRQPGYQSVTGGVDRASGRLVVVSTWDTEDHARWSVEALGDLVPRFRALGVQLDPPEVFEATTT
jgi:hypothetical protein